MVEKMAEGSNRRLDAGEKVVKNMDYGRKIYYADDWINELVFDGTPKEVARRLKKLFTRTVVR